MRILITTDAVGGVWDHTVTLARELIGRGHDVRVAAVGRVPRARLSALPVFARGPSAEFRLEWAPGGLDDVRSAARWIRRSAREHRADLVHLNQFAYAAHELGAPTVVVAHSDVCSWWAQVHGTDAPAEWSAYREAVGRGLAAADLVVSPTAYQSELLCRHFGRAADRIIWNGAPPPSSAPGTRPERPFIVWAGRAWDLAKGLATLDAALELLGDAAPEGHLLGPTVAPDGSAYVPSRLKVHGTRPRHVVDRWLARAALYVAPSLYEPFGLAPLEAALRGCALVLSDIGSFRELWNDCALFFPPGDAERLAGVLRILLEEPARRRELALRAAGRARSRYTAERMCARYEAAYRGVLAPFKREAACA